MPEAVDPLKWDFQVVVSYLTLVLRTYKGALEQQYMLLITDPSPGPQLFNHKEMVENQVKKTLVCVYECFASVYKVYHKYAPCLGQKRALDLYN